MSRQCVANAPQRRWPWQATRCPALVTHLAHGSAPLWLRRQHDDTNQRLGEQSGEARVAGE
jgi:hypothetical protein